MAASLANPNTRGHWYTKRLAANASGIVAAQLPYRLHIASLRLGRTLDVGCGIGRHLRHLRSGSVGLDHNAYSIRHCRLLGFTAYTPEEFEALPSEDGKQFEALLLSHVLEHMPLATATELVATYAKYLLPHARIIMITPQIAGFASDPTHVTYLTFSSHASIIGACGLTLVRQYSFPFPSIVGSIFKHNEFVSIASFRNPSTAVRANEGPPNPAATLAPNDNLRGRPSGRR